MTKLRILMVLLLLALAGGRGDASLFGGGESKAFEAATKSYQFKIWDRAEKEFADFIQDHPKSERLAEAAWLQAQAQFEQRKFDAVEALLTARIATAGNLADQYWYWIGQAQMANSNYVAAAETFGKLAREFPASAKRLEAAVKEAAATGKLERWEDVVEMLRSTNRPFRVVAAQTPARNEWVARGFLLLAEAQLTLRKYPEAEAALNRVEEGLGAELDWQRRYLLCRTLAESGRIEEAARVSEVLIQAARGTTRWDLVSDSVVFQAELLERLGRWNEAIKAWKLNFTNAPVARQRQALTKAAALAIQHNHLPDAVGMLAAYLEAFTNSPAADVAWLTLGELHLKQHVAGAGPNQAEAGLTNRLALAADCFQQVLKKFPGSAYAGKAQLNLGWCHWLEHQWPESEAAFEAAAKRLAGSEERAVALFKLADAQFVQSNYPAALTNYREVLAVLTNWPPLDAALRTPASYQALRASLALTNVAGAEQAVAAILTDRAPTEEAVGSVLLLAQSYVDARQPEAAQKWFAEFVRLFPDSLLRPEVEVLVAQFHEEQGEWAAAARAYDEWLARYATNRLRPQVEFQRALAAAGLGEETNALQRLTNFIAQFPQHELAPQAQWWVADWYYQQGNYQDAEIGYKQLLQNWPRSELANEARMMAGRAAFWRSGRSGYGDAIEHFKVLVSDTNCPPRLRIQAMSAYGAALLRSPPPGTNKLELVATALQVYREITRQYPSNELTAAVWGELGNCALTLSDYAYASNAYREAVNFPGAGVGVRCRAKAGLAEVLEKQAQLLNGTARTELLVEARGHLLDVYLDNKFLRENETEDLFWKKKAGWEAARLSEVLKEWSQAVELYRDLLRQNLLPRSQLESKIEGLQKQLSAGGGGEGTKI